MKTNPLVARMIGLSIGVLGCLALLAQGVTEEVPRGGLTGTLTMSENGRPLPKAAVYLTEVNGDRYRYVHTDDQGRFVFRNVVAGAYALSFSAKAHTAEEQTITIAEGPATVHDVALAPSPPYLDFHYSTHTYTPGEKPEYQLTGFTQSANLEVAVYRLDFNEIAKGGSLYSVLSDLRWDRNKSGMLKPENQVAKFERTPQMVDAEGVFIEKVALDPMPEGVYWIEATSGTTRAGSYAMVTTTAAVAKASSSGTLCYVTDIVSGQPIAGAKVTLMANEQAKAEGVTNASGLVELPVAGDSEQVLVVQRGADSFAMVSFWNSGERSDGVTISTYTDRPIYRPGHTIEFKGLARRWANDAYQAMPNTPVLVQVRDPRDNLVESLNLTTTGAGSFTGSFSLSTEAEPGTYYVVTQIGQNTHYGYVTVANYSKPEMQLTVKPGKPVYLRGDQVEMTVQAEYFFGGPVVGASVTGYILRNDAYGGGWWDTDNDSGEYVQDYEGTTDANGKFVLRFGSRTPNNPNELDSQFTVYATVSEADGRSVSGEGKALVARGEYSLEVEPLQYTVVRGQQASVRITMANHADGKPVANREVRIVSATERWANGREVRDPGTSLTAKTNAEGVATVRVPTNSDGALVVRASAQDDRGNTIEATTQVWVGDVSWGPESDQGLTVTLDRAEYGVGDEASVLIRTPNPGGVALVTVEADRIYMTRLVPLTAQSTRIELDVDRRMAPNAFVSAVYVRNKRFDQADASLAVNVPDRKLQVTVESDAASYLPGREARFKVTTRDVNGNPVPAEFSFGLVDEAIYTLKEDRFDPYEEFYPQRYNGVQTSHSFPEVYLDGDEKGPVSVDIRREFKDTATWQPVLETDDTGTANVTVRLPDNLTGWRATVVAITDDAKVGKSTHKIVAKKPVMVRLQPPTFLVDGDEQVIGAVVMNETSQDAEFDVELKAVGVTILSDAKQRASIRRGGSHSVSWRVKAAQATSAVLTVTAVSNGSGRPSDGMESRVPVMTFGDWTRDARAGSTDASARLDLNLQSGAYTEASTLKITLASTLASDMFTTLDALVEYPYGCVEQTMSRFMPLVVASRAVDSLGLPPLARRAEIPKMVRASYDRLRNLRSGQAWGWWQNGDLDPYMTAYVLEGFYRASLAGYPPPADLVGPALDESVKWLASPPPQRKGDDEDVVRQRRSDMADRAYLAHVLALHGRDSSREVASQRMDPQNPDAVALLGLAAVALGDQAKAAEAIGVLSRSAKTTDQQAHWDPASYFGVETTSRALSLLSHAAPSNPLIPKVVRYLTSMRRADGWSSTRDTALTLVAIISHLQRTQELTTTPIATLLINGETIFGAPLDRARGATSLNVPVAKLKSGANTIEVRAEGGTVYYSVQLDQVVPRQEIEAKPSAIVKVTRSYHTLEPRRLEDGTLRLGESRNPVEKVTEGTTIRVKLTLEANQVIPYAMIEDPFPSNLRPQVRYDLEPWEDWRFWFSGASQRDDRMVFFSRWLNQGTNVIEYELIAESTGVSRAAPVKVSNMYDPSVFATSASNKFEVTKR